MRTHQEFAESFNKYCANSTYPRGSDGFYPFATGILTGTVLDEQNTIERALEELKKGDSERAQNILAFSIKHRAF